MKKLAKTWPETLVHRKTNIFSNMLLLFHVSWNVLLLFKLREIQNIYYELWLAVFPADVF